MGPKDNNNNKIETLSCVKYAVSNPLITLETKTGIAYTVASGNYIKPSDPHEKKWPTSHKSQWVYQMEEKLDQLNNVHFHCHNPPQKQERSISQQE